MWRNKNGVSSGFYLVLALTSGPEPPIMSWYSRKKANFAHKCEALNFQKCAISLAIKP